MKRLALLFALVLALGFAMPGAKTAKAGSAITAAAQTLQLGERISEVSHPHISKAGVRFHLYVGPRYRYHRRRYYRHRHYRRHRRSCRYWSRRCASNWGYRNSDYYGCMRYHGCR